MHIYRWLDPPCESFIHCLLAGLLPEFFFDCFGFHDGDFGGGGGGGCGVGAMALNVQFMG